MSDNKGNTGVVLAIIGVAAALGVTLWLLTKKSSKIDKIGLNIAGLTILKPSSGGAIVTGQPNLPINTVQSNPYSINSQLGIGGIPTISNNLSDAATNESGDMPSPSGTRN